MEFAEKEFMSANPYEVLGVAKDADETTIKKAYRKLAMVHHPDKGGDQTKFNQIGTAYEILSNPEKRRLYDLGGSDAVERGHAPGEGGGDFGDIFSSMFGGGGRGGRAKPSGPVKGDPAPFALELSLEEMYIGVLKKLRLIRTIACTPCNGKGGSNSSTCSKCSGRGVRVIVQRLGPGMISQSQATCDGCRGAGTIILPKDVCQSCQGEKTVKEKKNAEVKISPGTRSQQTYVLIGEGDQLPGQLAGDIIVTISEKKHDRFERRGHHLFYRQKISLLQALTGFTLYIQHLDGHQVKIQSKEVIKPGMTMKIEGEGFPHSFGEGRGIDTGNLYVEFDIVFPTTAQIQGKVKSLQTALPDNCLVQNTPVKTPGSSGQQDTIVEAYPQLVDLATPSSVENRLHKAEENKWNTFLHQQEKTAYRSGGGHDDGDDEDMGHHGMGQPACQQL